MEIETFAFVHFEHRQKRKQPARVGPIDRSTFGGRDRRVEW